MAVTEDIARLILDIQGGAKLQSELKAAEGALEQLQAQLRAGIITFDQFEAESDQMVEKLHELRASSSVNIPTLEGLGQSVGQVGKTSAATGEQADKLKTAVGKGNLGLGFLEMSRAIEDAQYGMGGVLNNLPNMVSLFGGPAGLAAVVSITAVALYKLGPALIEAFKTEEIKLFGDRLEDLKEKVKALEAKPLKLAADYTQIDAARKEVAELEKALAAFQAAAGKQTTTEQEAAGLATTAVVEHAGGAENLRDFVRERIQRTPEGRHRFAEEGAALADIVGQIAEAQKDVEADQADLSADPYRAQEHSEKLANLKVERDKLKEQIGKATDEQVKALVGNLLRGEEAARKEVLKLVQMPADGTFRAGGVDELFAGFLAEASPERIRQRRTDTRDAEQEKRMAELDRSRRDKAEKAEKDRAKAEADRVKAAAQATKDEEEVGAKLRENEEKRQEGAGKQREKDTQAEAKKIQDTLGKQTTLRYEGLLAENQARIAAGDPGAMDPRRLAQSLQAQMIGLFRQRGASPEAAGLAAKNITGAGQQDLARRQSLVAGRTQDTQAQMLMMTRDLMMEYQKLDGTQQALHQEILAQRRALQGMRTRSKSQLRRVGR